MLLCRETVQDNIRVNAVRPLGSRPLGPSYAECSDRIGIAIVIVIAYGALNAYIASP